MPRKAAPAPAVQAADEAQPVERTVTISFPVPESLHYAIKVRAAQERTTVRGMVLKGLKSVGLEVSETDLTDRRPGRSGRKERT